jgi:hypothetical protein
MCGYVGGHKRPLYAFNNSGKVTCHGTRAILHSFQAVHYTAYSLFVWTQIRKHIHLLAIYFTLYEKFGYA